MTEKLVVTVVIEDDLYNILSEAKRSYSKGTSLQESQQQLHFLNKLVISRSFISKLPQVIARCMTAKLAIKIN